ncbi:fasciclin domain-containing protein [cf. Phormidesmis sp. LEGE 11477]|uniref:fasciclin domain-containing protein n=1 Tax=cf. Phormidesmis sp. LEGE 11477 TaxID=1828680 RepID=UPI001D150F6C|nr:fasciclin domain-containing protein [cf. Phormidesmis sp. LEGE 11477]
MRFSKLTVPFNRLAILAAALMILPVAVACDTPSDEVSEAPTEMPDAPVSGTEATDGTIVDVAVDSGSFSTLIAAVQAAGLEEALSSEGPFTVFAPTDEAFDALPPGALDELLLPENKGALTQVLAYHVVPGAITSDQIQTGTVTSIEESDLDLVADDMGVTVNGANVVSPDMVTSNGVIHAIDAVLLPPSLTGAPPAEEMPGEVAPPVEGVPPVEEMPGEVAPPVEAIPPAGAPE